MKNWIMIAVAAFSVSFSQGFGYGGTKTNEPERVAPISAKAILQNSNGYFVLADGTLWKAIGFSKRWRTLTEWWNNVQLVPENYECVPNDWFLGTDITVYSKYGNLGIKESDASNEETLKQCTHLLVNNRTGQVLFAIALDPAAGLVSLFNDAHHDCYIKGYNEGRAKNYQNANEIYNNGYSDGYKEGYADGCQTVAKKDGKLN